MANLAVVFHWPPSEMCLMTLDELMMWNQKAADRTQVEE